MYDYGKVYQMFHINPQLDIPIYQQLVDNIRTEVKQGKLEDGQQLPTVQELAQSLGLAKGTIKRAYDELEHLGLIEKVQGRGTFIRCPNISATSRKQQAMFAIDRLLDELEEMGFSAMEIGIYLSLKQREHFEKQSILKVAVLECNPESLSYLSEQMRAIKGIDLYSYLLDGIQEYPYKLDEEMDLVVTTSTHAQYVESILSNRNKLVRIALRLSVDTLSGIIRLEKGMRVGILCESERFANLAQRSCRELAEQVCLQMPVQFSPQLDAEAYLKDKDAVLVPKGYEKYCSAETARCLQRFADTGKLILCAYEMDSGSALMLEEKLRQLWEEKNIKT